MSNSTWNNITLGMLTAIYEGYQHKTARQRQKKEVADVWQRKEELAIEYQEELKSGAYAVGKYRHFPLRDKKKVRDISVLSFKDRCVQNDMKDAMQPLAMRYMTDDMLGGLPGRGVVARDKRYSVVAQMRKTMNNNQYKYYLQGDVSKFYDHVDKVISMQLIEQVIKDKRTLALIRQHLFNQKKLAIGDPFSHLIANLNMSVIIRKAKTKYGNNIKLINFADDFIAFAREKDTLVGLRQDMRLWAKQMRLHYKTMYVQPIDAEPGKQARLITFCGYRYSRGYVRLVHSTKVKYIKSRHKRASVGSYNGLLRVADTKNLRRRIEIEDNKMNKIRRRFSGKPKKIDNIVGINHTIVDFEKRPSNQKDCNSYYHIQALADGLGLIVYCTASSKIAKLLDTKTRADIPIRNMTIVHDWSGYYYEGTVYTDEEEEELIRQQYDIPDSRCQK
jgi:hypothetical protein